MQDQENRIQELVMRVEDLSKDKNWPPHVDEERSLILKNNPQEMWKMVRID